VTTETFELSVTLPPDDRFAGTAAAIAVHAAQFAGCPPAVAQGFGRDVEAAVRACVDRLQSAPAAIPLIVRRDAGPVEAIVDGRTLRVDV
jgi:predicted small secreted protein